MDPALYAYPSSDRAWVRTNFVATIDGAVTDAEGVSGSLGGEADHRAFTIMRSLADVVLVGAGTAREEGYGPIEPSELDLSLPGSRMPVLAVVSGSLDLPDPLRTAGVLAVTTTDADAEAVAALEADGVEVLQHGDDAVDWPAVLKALADRGLPRVLCEGGPGLHGTLAHADLVDEVCLSVAPVLTSGVTPGITSHDAPHTHRDFVLAHAVAEGGTLLTRWVRDR